MRRDTLSAREEQQHRPGDDEPDAAIGPRHLVGHEADRREAGALQDPPDAQQQGQDADDPDDCSHDSLLG